MSGITNASEEITGLVIVIDENIDSYASFYDAHWAGEFSSITEATALSEAGLELIGDWKGPIYTAAMPFLLVDGLVSYNAAMQASLPVSQGSLPTRSEIWERFREIPGFNLILWSSQRICYGAIFHAYENFLRHCVAVSAGIPMCKWGRPALKKKLNKIRRSLGDECLADDAVEFAGDIRDSLAHNGGRISPEIERGSERYKVRIEHGRVHIMPENTRNLFGLLKQKAMAVAGMAKSDSRFQRSQPHA